MTGFDNFSIIFIPFMHRG